MRNPAPDRLALPVVLLLALGLRLFALSGEMGPDSSVYAQYAYQIAHGGFQLGTDSWYAHRLPVFAPTALLYALLGVGRLTTAAWPLLLSLLQVTATVLLGRRLFGPAAGLLAGLVLALLPLEAIESGRLMPDAVLGSLLGLAGATWLGIEERRSRGPGLTAGLLVGLAAMVRPYALLGLLLMALDAIGRRALRPRLGWAMAGVAIVGLPLALLYGVTTGDPLHRWHVVASIYGSGVIAEGAQLGFYPGLLLSWWKSTGLHPLLLMGCVALALTSPGRDRLRLLVWIGVFLLFLELGSMSLERYVPILKRLRFLTPLSLPSAVLVGSVLAGSGGWTTEQRLWIPPVGWLRRLLRGAIVVGLLGLLALGLWRIGLDRQARLPRYRAFEAVAARVGQEPGNPILLDHWRTAIRLAYHLRFREGAFYYRDADDRVRMLREQLPEDARLGYLGWYPRPEELPAAFVLVDEVALVEARAMAKAGRTYAEGEIPAYAWQPPPSWTLLLEGGGLRLYRTPGPG